MKDRLLIATLAGVGFLAALGISAVRGDLWQPSAALDPAPPSRTRLQTDAMPLSAADRPVTPTPAGVAAAQPQPAAPASVAAAPDPGREGANSDPAPTYEQQTAARDRAAARSARSR